MRPEFTPALLVNQYFSYMRAAKTYRVIIDYYGKKFSFHVKHFLQKNDAVIYELQCGGVHYIVLNEDEKWTFLAKIPPCEEFKNVIVASLLHKQKSIQLPKLFSGPGPLSPLKCK